MQSDFQNFFKFICSYYDYEISEKLKSHEYNLLKQESKNLKSKLLAELKDKKLLDEFIIALHNEMSCYYEQASIIALQHFISMLKENNLI